MSETAPSSKKIDKIIQRMEEGEIKIPAFQRPFVWKQEQILELLESIYNDYPIGSVLFWNTNDRLKTSRNVAGFLLPERRAEYPVDYVLDGQQRLATIYGVFARERTVQEEEDDDYSVDHNIFDICFDLDTKEFIPKDSINTEHRNLEMKVLFDVAEFHNSISKFSRDQKNIAQDLQSRFSNYEIPIITTNKRDKGEVGIIFERINTTGTRLSTVDLMIAWTWTEDFHLREEFNAIQESLEEKNFEDITDKVLLQCLGAIIKRTTVAKDVLKLEPSEVREKISILSDGIPRAIDFLFTELNVKSKDFLPHIQQIVPLVFLFSQKSHFSEEIINIIKKWFWKTSFSLRYRSSTDKKMDEDIAFFEKVLKGDRSLIKKYSSEVSAEILLKQKFSKSNPYTRAFLLLMAQKTPLDLTNSARIDIEKALSKYNRKEYHHIFPKKFLKNEGYNDSEINTLLNMCFLPASSNKKILDKSPSVYIKKVPKKKYSRIMESNLMPDTINLYKKNDYKRFLESRSKIVLDAIGEISK